MIKNFQPAKQSTIIEDFVDFDIDEHGTGFSFPCEPGGEVNVEALPPEAQENYRDCMAHPERFVSWNKRRTEKRPYVEPASGDCVCGEHIKLEAQYKGACQCPGCGRWYNMFGQSLLPPEQWESEG